MNATAARPSRLSGRTYRWVRQIHLWIGAWGALAAILFGTTGLVQNNRIGENAWPQGTTTEVGRTTLPVPEEARAAPEQLSLWLRQTRNLDATSIRKGGPGGRGGRGGGADRWMLNGGSARHVWSLEYTPGSDSAELRHSDRSLLAALISLHKGVSGGTWWKLLEDSFAIGMILLGLSGIWMWARGRSAKQMVASVFGLAVLAFVAVVGLALS